VALFLNYLDIDVNEGNMTLAERKAKFEQDQINSKNLVANPLEDPLGLFGSIRHSLNARFNLKLPAFSYQDDLLDLLEGTFTGYTAALPSTSMLSYCKSNLTAMPTTYYKMIAYF
jgi:hypothetical protein